MTMFDPFDLRAENKVYQRALRIMAKEILGWGLLWEEMVATGDVDAHVSIPKDQTEEIDNMVAEYLEEAREEIKVVLFKADVPSKNGVIFPAETLRDTAMHSQHLMFDEDNLELYYMEYAGLEEKT